MPKATIEEQATLELLRELEKGEASTKEKGYVDINDVEELLGIIKD